VFPKPDPSAPPLDVRFVSHDYTRVMGIRIIDGRPLDAGDAAGRPRALLINETLARAMFGTTRVVGEPLFVGGRPTFEPPGQTGPLEPWTIAGVVADVRQRSVIDPASAQIFVDQRQIPGPTGSSAVNVVVRGETDAATLIASVRPMVAQLDPQSFIDNIAPMDSLVSNTFARPRLYAQVLGLYSLVAIALVAVGIYGVIAFAVVQRTREIGIRMALGAQRAQVLRLIVRDSIVVAGAGLALGILGSVWSSRLFEGLLYGVTPLDRATYLTVATAFMLIASIAAFIPARRASAVDPVSALRAE
jgi:putative ABC transport system permease protein